MAEIITELAKISMQNLQSVLMEFTIFLSWNSGRDEILAAI